MMEHITPKRIGIFAACVLASVLLMKVLPPPLPPTPAPPDDAAARRAEADAGAAAPALDGEEVDDPLPATLAEAEPKLVAVVRERIGHEVARIAVSPKPLTELHPEPPHVGITEELWGVLAYETNDKFVRIDTARFTQWNTSFEKLWAAAVAKLKAHSTSATTSTTSGVHEFHYGDGNDSARILIPSVFAKLEISGDPVVAMPKADTLLVVGSNDNAALEALADRLVDEWEQGSQNMRVVRVAGGAVTPFAPPPSHPLHARFEDLRKSAEQRDEKLQREALKKRFPSDGTDVPFTASVLRYKNPKTKEELEMVVNTEDTPTLLPRADWVVFKRVDLAKKTATTLACGTWDKVFRLMSGRWKPTPFHPARWLATDFPTAQELKTLGCEHPRLALELGVPQRTE